MRKLLVLLVVSFPATLWAQESGHVHNDTIATFESVPQRPLAVATGSAQAHTGLGIGLSDRIAGETWWIPVGGGFGLMSDLEVGLDLNVLLAPWAIQTVLSTIDIYGRYIVVPEMVAGEVIFHVPTAFTNNFGVQIGAPMRFQLDPVELFAHARLAYRGTTGSDSIFFGASATGLFNVVDALFVAADLGVHLNATEIIGWETDFVLAAGLGAGYEILDDMFVKATFNVYDLASDAPFDGRSLTIVLVTATDLGSTAPIQPITSTSE